MTTPADNLKTLANFILEVREQADIVGLETRHSDALLTRMINASWRDLRTKVTNAGFDYFLLSTDVAALPTSAVESGEQYTEVDWPTGAAKIYGFDVQIGTGWFPLQRGTWQQRRDYQSTIGTISAGTQLTPGIFVPRTLPTESTTGVSAGKIALFPLDTRGNNYRIWYLPYWVDIAAANTTYVFFGHDDWFQWAVYDVCWKVFVRDQEEMGLLDRVAKARDDIWMQIVRATQKMLETGPVRVRLSRRRHRTRF